MPAAPAGEFWTAGKLQAEAACEAWWVGLTAILLKIKKVTWSWYSHSDHDMIDDNCDAEEHTSVGRTQPEGKGERVGRPFTYSELVRVNLHPATQA